MQRKIRVSLCCLLPRVGFGSGERHVSDELKQMEEYLNRAQGEIVVFPEGYLKSEDCAKACKIARRYDKWLILGTQDQGQYKSLYTVVIDPDKGLVYSHCKSALTDGDRKDNARLGKSIEALDTPFGKIGTILCYEMHFPEVARIECLDGAWILFNTIGTGMWHEQQFDEWTTLAKARAIENRCFVLGTTHYCDPIPMMYAYDPHGRLIGMMRNHEGIMEVEIDRDLIDERDYFKDRNPEAYTKITEGGNI
ncbi:MAG: carbon-nitrogen hydrolase family protein [Erysipelotrichaceae bacterium]|nr:carbon-nitrogen hydrolase family protein [Erysipelotrichaceae bacterium]